MPKEEKKYIEKGQAVLGWGLPDEAWGTFNSLDIDNESDKDEVKGGQNQIVSVVYSNFRKKVSCEYTPFATITGAPFENNANDLIGKEMTVNDVIHGKVTFFIESASTKSKSASATTFSVNGYYYPDINTTVAKGGN